MASVSEIAQVRLNTNEPTDVAPYLNAYIEELIDSVGVAGATASIWESKAAAIAATAVDITEADATHKMSDKFDHANAMIKYWRRVSDDVVISTTDSIVRVKKIVRT
jgi:hypothetical protein